MTPGELAAEIRRRANDAGAGQGRFITALAGPPGAGKSTLAEAVVAALGQGARLVPMDGFHFDDAVLTARGHKARKGAPHTFDATGFVAMVRRLRAGGDVAIPVFDRTMELSRAAADVVTDEDRLLVVEGNYLLLNRAPWTELAPLFDLTVMLSVPEQELERRLIQRWVDHGRADGPAWVQSNDMPNVRTVLTESRPADITLHPYHQH